MTTALGYAIPNVLLLTSHSIAEHDDLDMFTRMGVPTFSIGAYTNPQRPGDDKRPPLPNAPYFAEFEALCHEQRAKHDGEPTDFGSSPLVETVYDVDGVQVWRLRD